MPYKTLTLMVLAIMGFFFMVIAPVTAQQQANLSDIGNATVTLYYYDKGDGIKGAIVPMPDNPQQVNYDTAVAAPGMYTFSHVPAGQWYYLEADHNGNKWYAIFYMEENVGTKTANVNIPPFRPVNRTTGVSPSPSVYPASSPTALPCPTATAAPVPSPGMAFVAAAIAVFMMALKRR
jgi:hypothetical protein